MTNSLDRLLQTLTQRAVFFMNKKRVFVLLSLSAACLLSFAVFFLILKNGGEDTQVTAKGENASATFLFAGVDDAGENTDMLMLCRISKEKGSVHFVQIPRDTFYKTETGKGKINRVYRQNVSKYGESFTLPLSREDMAAYLGTNRSALSRELGKMRDEGIIEFERNSFKIKHRI